MPRFQLGTDLSAYADNKFEEQELISQDLYKMNIDRAGKCMKYALSREVWHRMIQMKATCYILTEDQLKELVRNRQ